jgi:hypothetical protein
MSENVSSSEQANLDDIQGNSYIEELFGKEGPIIFKNTLDTRGFKSIGSQVFEVVIPDVDAIPNHLGEWPEAKAMGIPQLPNTWAMLPREEAAIKLVNLDNPESGYERRALLVGNAAFPANASFRPIQLYGYGVGDIHLPAYNEVETRGYLFVERISPEYKPFYEYAQSKGILPPLDAIQLASNMSRLMQPLHDLGISHGDLENERDDNHGKEAHLFIDPESGRLRLIDWSHSVSRDIDPKFFSTTMYLDHVGIAQILEYSDFSRYSSVVQELLEKIYVLSGIIDLDDEDESPEYSRDATGTQAQYEDIQKLLLLLQQEEKK